MTKGQLCSERTERRVYSVYSCTFDVLLSSNRWPVAVFCCEKSNTTIRLRTRE